MSRVTERFSVMCNSNLFKSWLAENNLDKGDLTVLKFDETSSEWNELDTLFDSEDDSYYYYVVELDSFSYFAIAEKAKTPIVSAIADSNEKASQTKFGLVIWWSVFVILTSGIIMVLSLIIAQIKKGNTKNLGEEGLNDEYY